MTGKQRLYVLQQLTTGDTESVPEPSSVSSKGSSERSSDLLKARARDPLRLSGAVEPAAASTKVIAVRRLNKNGKIVSQMKRKGKRKGKGTYGHYGYDSVGTMRTLLPDEVDVELPFVVSAGLTNNGLAYASYRWRPNGCYDPDPAVGGTSYVGLAEWGALYNYYRVLGYSYELEVSNREAFPMFVDIYNLNTDPGATVGSSGMYYASNAFGKTVSLGPLTGGRSSVRVRGNVPLAALVGTDSVETEQNWVGVTLVGNPADLVYFGFNTRSDVVQTTAGVYYNLRFRARVRFFDRAILDI